MLLSWLGPALILAAPQTFWRGLTAAFILPKLLLLGLGTALCAAEVLARRRQARATSLDGPLAGLAAIAAASAVLSVDPWLSLVGRHGGFSDSLWGLSAALGCWYAASWLDEPRRALIPRLALWAGAAAAAHALLQSIGLDPWGIGPLPTGRAVAGVGSPVDLGGILALLFPLAVEASRQKGRPAVERALSALYLAGLAATGSRAAWLGAVAGASVVLGLSSGPAQSSRRRIIAVSLLAAALASAVAWRAGARRTFRDSDEARVAVWRTALRAVQARPLLGYGPGTFEHAFRLHRTPDDIKLMRGAYQLQDHAHNGVLDALAQGGALNLAAWLWVCAALAAALWSARGAPGVPAAAAGAVAVAVILQVDPLSVEVFASAAFLIGAALAPGAAAPARSRAFPAGLAALGLAGALTTAWMIGADWHAGRAGRSKDLSEALALYQTAIAANPACAPYVISYINKLGEAVNAAPTAAEKAALLERAANAGRDIVRRRPNDMKAHYSLGIAFLMAAQVGLSEKLPLAAAALDEARALDPWHEPLLVSRLETAQRMGDAPTAADLQARLARLR